MAEPWFLLACVLSHGASGHNSSQVRTLAFNAAQAGGKPASIKTEDVGLKDVAPERPPPIMTADGWLVAARKSGALSCSCMLLHMLQHGSRGSCPVVAPP